MRNILRCSREERRCSSQVVLEDGKELIQSCGCKWGKFYPDRQKIESKGPRAAQNSKLNTINRRERVVYLHDAQGTPQTSLVCRVDMLADRLDRFKEQGPA